MNRVRLRSSFPGGIHIKPRIIRGALMTSHTIKPLVMLPASYNTSRYSKSRVARRSLRSPFRDHRSVPNTGKWCAQTTRAQFHRRASIPPSPHGLIEDEITGMGKLLRHLVGIETLPVMAHEADIEHSCIYIQASRYANRGRYIVHCIRSHSANTQRRHRAQGSPHAVRYRATSARSTAQNSE